jgi:hypothetical protein
MNKWIISLLFVCLPVSAEIYRWIDNEGNVIYSDQPNPKAEQIELSPTTTYSPTVTVQPEINIVEEKSEDDLPVPPYELRIVSPGQNESIWVNSGNLSVTLIVEPVLDVERQDKIRLLLDGLEVGVQASTTFQLKELSRGQHQLSAEVVDNSGKTLIQASSVTFQLHRASVQ